MASLVRSLVDGALTQAARRERKRAKRAAQAEAEAAQAEAEAEALLQAALPPPPELLSSPPPPPPPPEAASQSDWLLQAVRVLLSEMEDVHSRSGVSEREERRLLAIASAEESGCGG